MPATLTTDTIIIKIQDTKVANKCRIDTIKREHTENKHNSDVFTHITADTKETYKGSSPKLQWIYHQQYNHLKIWILNYKVPPTPGLGDRRFRISAPYF